jgi:ubiquinone biosynthesis protein UbiJ
MRRRFAGLAIVLAACGSRQPVSDRSHAADEIIDSAKTPEERAELMRVRDEVDAAAQDRIRKLDAEIERLEKENAELRKR